MTGDLGRSAEKGGPWFQGLVCGFGVPWLRSVDALKGTHFESQQPSRQPTPRPFSGEKHSFYDYFPVSGTSYTSHLDHHAP